MKKMKNILLWLGFLAIALSVYNCGYKGPLYMPHNNEASRPVTEVNNAVAKAQTSGKNESTGIFISTKSNEIMASKNSIKVTKQNESSIENNNINFRSNLNESN